MATARFECIFATDEPFHGFRLAYDEDEGFKLRKWEARLTMSADAIHGDLSTPAGIQVLFGHDQERQSVGRVLSMGFGDGMCRGVIELNEDDLKSVVAGGFDALENGINSGLSLGMTYLDGMPKFEAKEGTDDEPDILEYPKMEAREVSLTSVPRLKQAGIVRRMESEDGE